MMTKVHRCEAVVVCITPSTPPGTRCPETLTTKHSNGRWLCWVHRHNVGHPEVRKHMPQKYTRASP